MPDATIDDIDMDFVKIIQIRLIMGKVHWNISKKTEDL